MHFSLATKASRWKSPCKYSFLPSREVFTGAGCERGALLGLHSSAPSGCNLLSLPPLAFLVIAAAVAAHFGLAPLQGSPVGSRRRCPGAGPSP